MTYRDAVEALQAQGRFGVRLGLGRTRGLLQALGDPGRDLRGALVGGTNGKGSVQALVGAALSQAGHLVGQTPKPHLVSYRERIVLGGVPILPDDFARLVSEVLEAADQVARRLGPPTEFELMTAAALTWFARQGAEVGVIEVGLGGRLDATNAWDGGVAAITNVDRDHMEYLGDTLVAIAREKAQIIKRGDRAVTGVSGDPLEVIRRRARGVGAPLDVVQPLPVVAMDRAGLVVRAGELGEIRVGLLGRHQAANAAVALGVLSALGSAGIARVEPDHVRAGFAGARWPGRMELLAVGADGRAHQARTDAPDPSAPDLLLDGAHNAAGARVLAEAVDELRPRLSPGSATLLLGILRDKEALAMTAALQGSATLRDAQVVATRVPGTPRALAAREVAAAWRESWRSTASAAAARPPTGSSGPARQAAGSAGPVRDHAALAVEDADDAIALAVELGRAANGPIVVAGSLYLVGHARGKLLDDPLLRDPED